MPKSLLVILTVLLLFIANGQKLPSISAESNYCDIQTLTTPELLLQITKDYNQPIDRSTFKIKETQHYERDTTTISLGYIENEGDILIEETSAKLASKIYTEDIDGKLVYIDGRDGYVIALEVANDTAYSFNYVLLKADIENGLETKMTKYQLVKTTSEQSENGETITESEQFEGEQKLDILRILEVKQEEIYLLIKEGTQEQQSLYKIDLLPSPTESSLESQTTTLQLQLLTTINEPNRIVNLIGGNIYHLYDRNSMRFYELSIITNSETQETNYSYSPKMLSELQIDTLINLDTLEFLSLENGVEIMLSYLNGETIVLPLTYDSIQPEKSIRFAGKPTVFSDNWRNSLIITDNDFLWMRTIKNTNSNTLLWTYKLFSSTRPLQQRDELQLIMSNAEYISFDGKYAMIVSENIGSNEQGSLTSVLYDTETAPYFSIVDRLRNSINLDELKFTSNSNSTEESTITTESYLSSFKCNCVSLQVEKFDCYAGPMKCITVTKSIRNDCTKSA